MFSDMSINIVICSSMEPVEKRIDTSFWVVCPTDSKLCIIIGQGPYSASTSLGKGEGVNKESNNKKT